MTIANNFQTQNLYQLKSIILLKKQNQKISNAQQWIKGCKKFANQRITKFML